MILIYSDFSAEHTVHSIDGIFSICKSVYSVENRLDKSYLSGKALLYKLRFSQQYGEITNNLLYKHIRVYLEYNHFQEFVEYTI